MSLSETDKLACTTNSDHLGGMKYVRYLFSAANKVAGQANSTLRIFNKARHCVVVELLPWDSKILQRKTARVNGIFYDNDLGLDINIVNDLMVEIREYLHSRNVELISFRFNTKNRTVIDLLTNTSWMLRDTLNIYTSGPGLRLKGEPIDLHSYTRKDLTQKEAEVYAEEVGKTTMYGRILNDPEFSVEIAQTFQSLIFRRLLEDINVRAVGLQTGQTTVGISIGTFDAELKRELGTGVLYLWYICLFNQFKGKGLARLLLKSFLENVSQTNIVEVATQIDNFAANRLYQNFGLKLQETAHTFHLWL